MPPESATAARQAPHGPPDAPGPNSGAAARLTARPQTPRQRRRELRHDRARRRRIAERIAADPTLTDLTKTVAAAALRYSDDSAKPVCPSMAAMATGATCARRSARRCIVDLVEAGYVRRILRPLGGRRNATNLYYFCEPAGPAPYRRQGQRRRLRTRTACSNRGTAESSGTPKGLSNPDTTGPDTSVPPAPPPLQHQHRKPTPVSAAQPSPFEPIKAPPEPNPSLTRAHLAAARAQLRQLRGR